MAMRVRVPGSCGELVQGTINGVDFHITCPIDRFSEASVEICYSDGVMVPPGLDKTAKAVSMAIERCGGVKGISIAIKSELPHGKGMASSTADIAAAVIATQSALCDDISIQELANIALSIEPTDGVFFEGVVIYDHRQGKRFERVGDAPPLEILVLEPPGSIDTVTFNKSKPALGAVEESLVGEALEMAVTAIRSYDIKLLGEAVTMSAKLNQKILPKAALADVVDACRRKGGVGVNIAHSGSVMGMMAEAGYGQRLFERVSHMIPRTWDAYLVRLIDGGPQYAGTQSFIVTV